MGKIHIFNTSRGIARYCNGWILVFWCYFKSLKKSEKSIHGKYDLPREGKFFMALLVITLETAVSAGLADGEDSPSHGLIGNCPTLASD